MNTCWKSSKCFGTLAAYSSRMMMTSKLCEASFTRHVGHGVKSDRCSERKMRHTRLSEKIYNASVWFVLLYGSKMWVLSKADMVYFFPGRTTSAICLSIPISFLWENDRVKINPFNHDLMKKHSCMKSGTVLISSLWEIKMVQIFRSQMTWRTTSAWSVPLNWKKNPKVSAKTVSVPFLRARN